MKDAMALLVHLLVRLVVALGPGGTRAVLAENMLLKQQFLILRRSRRRAPNFRTTERLLFGFCSLFLSPRRLARAAIILQPATLLRFHRGFRDFKYRFLHSSRPRKPIHPEFVARTLSELAAPNAIFTCDLGTPTIWASRYLKMNGLRRFLGSFNHGSMANALPQAIGSQLAFPNRQMISMSGDGGFAILLGDVLSLKRLDCR